MNMAIIIISVGCEVIMMYGNMKWNIQINHSIVGMAREIYKTLIKNIFMSLSTIATMLALSFFNHKLFSSPVFFYTINTPFLYDYFLIMKSLKISLLGLKCSSWVIIIMLTGISVLTSPPLFLPVWNNCIWLRRNHFNIFFFRIFHSQPIYNYI